MFRVLQSLWVILREIGLALIWQPSRPGPTRAETQANAVQAENLTENLQTPATAWDAARQIGREVGKAAILQPTPLPERNNPGRNKRSR